MDLFRIKLQLFADDPEPKEDPKDDPEEKVELTKEEYEKQLSSEADRRVTKALQTAKEKWELEFGEKLEQERKEAARLAKLSEEEKQKELLEKTKKDIEERENALRRKELLSDTKDLLHDKKIPTKFADMLVKDNAENTMEAVKVFEGEWQKAIEEAVTEKLKGKTPKTGDTKTEKNPWSKEHLNLTQQAKILKEDPERAKKLQAEAL